MFATSALIYKSSDVTDMELFDVDSSYISIGVFAMCEKWMMNGRGIIPFPPLITYPRPLDSRRETRRLFLAPYALSFDFYPRRRRRRPLLDVSFTALGCDGDLKGA